MVGISTETQISIAEASIFPGFKFSPTDEELISFYLSNKIEGSESSIQIIPEIDICKWEPHDLPAKSVIKSDSEWFFFSPRGRKYPNGSQSKRGTENGYWKATGKERNVKSGSLVIGTKRTLVFHMGRAPKGERTEWIMHEYCMDTKSQDSLVVCRIRKNQDFQLTNNTQTQNFLNQKHTVIIENSNSAASEVGNDPMGKEGEGCSKNYSSSHDSYSVGESESTSKSNQKRMNAFSPSEYSVFQNDDHDENCYADILNDDIVLLDESSLPLDLPRKESKQQLQREISREQNLQGTANRRLRLSVSRSKNDLVEAVGIERKVYPETKCVFSVGKLGYNLMFVVFGIMSLLVLYPLFISSE